MSRPTSPRVSVIIRTKDRALLLARALDDVLAQDYDDWQLIVVNDGGEPATVDALVREKTGLVGRSRVLHERVSQGMEAASNAAVAATSGEFVCVHDDDDTWAPDFLSATVAWLDGHPTDVAVTVSTEIVIERIEGTDIVEVRREPFRPAHDIVTAFDLIVRNQFVPISLLMRRSAIEALHGFDESLPVVGDWDFHLRLALHGRVAYLDGPVRAFWRQRPDASGELANSVHSAQALHARFDRLVRDRALREYAADRGLGGLLYLGKLIDERVAESEQHTFETVRDALESMRTEIETQRATIDAMEVRLQAAVRYYGLGPTLKRNWRRVLRISH